jgi:hypothetical protein
VRGRGAAASPTPATPPHLHVSVACVLYVAFCVLFFSAGQLCALHPPPPSICFPCSRWDGWLTDPLSWGVLCELGGWVADVTRFVVSRPGVPLCHTPPAKEFR